MKSEQSFFHLISIINFIFLLERYLSHFCIPQHSSIPCSWQVYGASLMSLLITSVVSDSMRTHRQQPTRLPCPWDSPGKNTGVDCHFLLQCMKVESESEVAQSCPTLGNPMDCSPPGSSIRGIFQARVLHWVSLPSPIIDVSHTQIYMIERADHFIF